MQRVLIVLFIFFGSLFESEAQVLNPITWRDSVHRVGKDQLELSIMATLDKGWHIYSQHLDSDDGPIATKIEFTFTSDYSLIGNTTESLGKEEYDDAYSMTLRYIEDTVLFKQRAKINTSKPFTIKASVTYMVCNSSTCLPPETIEFQFAINGYKSEATISAANTQSSTNFSIETPNTSWRILVAGFIGGLLALLTPCVFPIIPLTVSFFTKQSSSHAVGFRNALIYGFFIILIYVGLGLLITLTIGPDALNAMASNIWVNLTFFLVFVVFAFSFLGAFEIVLPHRWVNSADANSAKSGLIGIFFMALTLSLVSFSCTGPIVGSLLVQAAVGGNIIDPLLGMFGFSLALALPFGLFAAFPGWLNSLPKSGGWLNSVKVVLGLLELALSLKFLSNVDLAYHWGIITREVFLCVWIVLFGWMGLYLAGKVRFPHDSPPKDSLSLPRFALSTLVLVFTLYLVPGLFGAPLKLISGFPPPQFYSEGRFEGSNSSVNNKIEGTHPEASPHGLPAFHDYEKALVYARKVNKPLLLDFTGWSCVNCRKMEDKVWVDERVLSTIKNDFVLVSLYVDDKELLPEKEVYVSQTTGKKIRTIGNKWSDFQTTRFKTNSQPFYVLIDTNENLLGKPIGYEPDVDRYSEFLQAGLSRIN